MSNSALMTHFYTYQQSLRAEHQSLLQSGTAKQRHMIDKTEFMGEKLVDIMLVQYCFLKRFSPIPEPLFKTVLSRIYPIAEQRTKIERRLLKRVVCKLFQEQRHKQLGEIQLELGGFVQTIIQQKIGMPLPQQESWVFCSFGDSQLKPEVNSEGSSDSALMYSLNTSFVSNLQEGESAQEIKEQGNVEQEELQSIKNYLDRQVLYSKTQLTQFCHQLKIKEPVYERAGSRTDSKVFLCKCTITIPQEKRFQFVNFVYVEQGEGLNTKNSTADAAKKLLYRIYSENVPVWKRFKEIKQKKRIST